jgi:hypothetical protein
MTWPILLKTEYEQAFSVAKSLPAQDFAAIRRLILRQVGEGVSFAAGKAELEQLFAARGLALEANT